MFIPTYKFRQGAFFNDEVGIVRKTELGRLCRAVLGFFVEFKHTRLTALRRMRSRLVNRSQAYH